MTEHPTDAPDWFQQYTTLARNDHWITVAGARIHYQSWNDQEAKPGLLFVHGHAAHAHWWDFIAPAFIDNYKVAAMDMSGAGDSDHRDAYSARTFAEEISQARVQGRPGGPWVLEQPAGESPQTPCMALNDLMKHLRAL